MSPTGEPYSNCLWVGQPKSPLNFSSRHPHGMTHYALVHQHTATLHSVSRIQSPALQVLSSCGSPVRWDNTRASQILKFRKCFILWSVFSWTRCTTLYKSHQLTRKVNFRFSHLWDCSSSLHSQVSRGQSVTYEHSNSLDFKCRLLAENVNCSVATGQSGIIKFTQMHCKHYKKA